MNPAFRLAQTPPPSRPLRLPWRDRGGQRRITDARVSLIVQRVIGDSMLHDETPYLLPRPVGQRTDLHLVADLEDREVRSDLRLLPAPTGDPTIQVRRGPLEWLDLRNMLVQLQIRLPPTRSVAGLELSPAHRRTIDLQIEVEVLP